jgi:hypothetical protein
MNRDMTTPIPLVSEAEAVRTQDRLDRLADPLGAGQGRIDTSGGGLATDAGLALGRSPRRGLVGVQAQAVALLIARLRAQTDGYLSRPVPLVEMPDEAGSAGTNGHPKGDSQSPVADFLDPVRYEWTEAAYEARQALKKYSEQTHADY